MLCEVAIHLCTGAEAGTYTRVAMRAPKRRRCMRTRRTLLASRRCVSTAPHMRPRPSPMRSHTQSAHHPARRGPTTGARVSRSRSREFQRSGDIVARSDDDIRELVTPHADAEDTSLHDSAAATGTGTPDISSSGSRITGSCLIRPRCAYGTDVHSQLRHQRLISRLIVQWL